jgi:hypothetical protein
MSRPAERVVAFYNKRGTAEQWIKEGKGAIKWTRLSCRTFAANAVRLQLHALAYNLGNFPRTLASPEAIKEWSLSSLKEKLIKIGAKVISHGRTVAFQMAEVAISRQMFQEILRLIAELRPKPPRNSGRFAEILRRYHGGILQGPVLRRLKLPMKHRSIGDRQPRLSLHSKISIEFTIADFRVDNHSYP